MVDGSAPSPGLASWAQGPGRRRRAGPAEGRGSQIKLCGVTVPGLRDSARLRDRRPRPGHRRGKMPGGFQAVAFTFRTCCPSVVTENTDTPGPGASSSEAPAPLPHRGFFLPGSSSPSGPAGWAASSVRSARLRGPLLVRCLPRAQGTTEKGQGLESLVTLRARPTPPHRGQTLPRCPKAPGNWAKCQGTEDI